MGVTVRERPKGSGIYWVFINHQGKRKARKIGQDKRLANRVKKEIEAKQVLRDFNLDTGEAPQTFGVYGQLWLNDYIKTTKRATTYQRYQSLFTNHIKPAIGGIRLDRLKRSDVRALSLKMHSEGLSRSSISTAKNVISGVLEYAMDADIIKTNISKGVLRKLGLDSHQGREIVRGMTPSEVELFLATCLKLAPKWYPFFLCAFRTGCRLGELLALEWGDIDFAGRFIQVQRSFRNGRLTATKTGKVRRVDMSDQLHDELSRLLTKSRVEGLAAGLGAAVEIIFHTDGAHTSQNSVRNVWKRVLGKAGLSDKRIHDIRHTYASTLLSTGASPVYVKEQLGHSSIQMTVDIYGHLIPGSNREAVNRLDSATNGQERPEVAQGLPNGGRFRK
jgi:integrase